MKRISVITPPLSEQQRIAIFLDKKCGEIDEAIALQEEFFEELEAYKQSVITEAVTRRHISFLISITKYILPFKKKEYLCSLK